MPILLRVPWGGGKRPMDPSKLNPVLAENSWKMIARASAEGIASQVWSIGDEIDIVLAGDYKGSITMQIAGFDHDDLVTGGKAGITFLSKQVLSPVQLLSRGYYSTYWPQTDWRGSIQPKIWASLPQELKDVIKKVIKPSGVFDNSSSGILYTDEESIFIPSGSELVTAGSALLGYQYTGRLTGDGTRYRIFEDVSSLAKNVIAGGTTCWWTRSDCRVETSTNIGFMYVYTDGKIYTNNADRSYGICFGFCM